VLFEPLRQSEIISPELLLEGIVLELSELTGDARAVDLTRSLNDAKREAGLSISRHCKLHGHLQGYDSGW
jgi:hypothetical protein